jgi:Rad3-related DNA helicase
MVEAGTGVGKSFAYLVPAILAASELGKKVVISTHTISLQEQLLQKDIPFLRPVMPQEFTAVLVKGRSNYVSLRRLDGARGPRRGDLPVAEEFEQLDGIRAWAAGDEDGSGRTSTSSPGRASGTPWPARTATAWAGDARGTATAITSRPGAGCDRRTSWSSTTPSS